MTFTHHNTPEAAPRLSAWDEALAGEYQEEVPLATLGREPQVVGGPSQWEVLQSALDMEPYQQEVPPDDCWIIPESSRSQRPHQKKGSKPLKYYSVLGNHTPNSQKLLKTSNECFCQAVAAQVTFPTDEELEKLSEKCFNKGLATFKESNADAPGKYSLVNATVAIHIHPIAQ